MVKKIFLETEFVIADLILQMLDFWRSFRPSYFNNYFNNLEKVGKKKKKKLGLLTLHCLFKAYLFQVSTLKMLNAIE